MKTNIRIFFVCAALFLLLEVALYFYVDEPVALYFSLAEDNHPDFVNFFRNITDLGKSTWYLWPCGLITLFCSFLARGKDVLPRYRRLFAYFGVRTFFLFSTISLSGIAADIIKPIVGRARPLLWLQDGIYGYFPLTFDARWNGMPSGHTATAFALAFSLAVFYPRLRAFWFAYAFILGFSRIAVDAHYLSDVCAGAVLGWLTVHLFLKYGMLRIWKVIFPVEVVVPPPI